MAWAGFLFSGEHHTSVRPPVMLYDDRCRLCLGFARAVNRLAGGRLTIVGHYTEEGRRLRTSLLYPEATEMFWVLEEREAHGGRAALLPLLRHMVTARGGMGMLPGGSVCAEDGCDVFVRSASLIRNSGHVEYGPSRTAPWHD